MYISYLNLGKISISKHFFIIILFSFNSRTVIAHVRRIALQEPKRPGSKILEQTSCTPSLGTPRFFLQKQLGRHWFEICPAAPV